MWGGLPIQGAKGSFPPRGFPQWQRWEESAHHRHRGEGKEGINRALHQLSQPAKGTFSMNWRSVWFVGFASSGLGTVVWGSWGAQGGAIEGNRYLLKTVPMALAILHHTLEMPLSSWFVALIKTFFNSKLLSFLPTPTSYTKDHLTNFKTGILKTVICWPGNEINSTFNSGLVMMFLTSVLNEMYCFFMESWKCNPEDDSKDPSHLLTDLLI